MPNYINEFYNTVGGIPCKVGIVSIQAYSPAIITPDPDSSHPSEEGVEFDIMDRAGKRALWLEAKLTEPDMVRIAQDAMAMMNAMVGY